MFIPIKEERFTISPDELEKMQWHEWVWNSHKWVETHKGYYNCEFCNMTWTNMMPISEHVRLCVNNPFINKER